MRLLDKIVFNRAVCLIFGFIISLIKIFMPKIGEDLEKNNPIPPMPKPPLLRKKRNRKENQS